MVIEKVKELKVEVRQFLTKKNDSYPDRKPVPFRVMYGYATQESKNGVYMVLKGKALPSDYCMRCGRKITHPTSLQFGLGSECINHVPGARPLVADENLEAYIKELGDQMEAMIWEGWLPKGHISYEETGAEIIPFADGEKEEKKEEVVTGRIYPKLSIEQERKVETVRLAYLDDSSKPKPTEIWIDRKGIIKVVFELLSGDFSYYKIERDDSKPSRTGKPYAPKYTKEYEISYSKAKKETPKKEEPKVDEDLVNELAKELNSLFS